MTDGPVFQPRRIKDHVLYALAFPSVSYVHQPVACLDRRRIRKTIRRIRIIFERQHFLPMLPVIGERHIQRTAPFVV